jgi:succinate dehydrogenase / fumarate reductase, membrane anchor subunit
MSDLRTPLRRVRGYGSAKHGVTHFLHQRITGAALVLLICWGFSQTPFLVGGGFDYAQGWLASPLNAALASLLLAVGLYHGKLGMQVVIEDYIAKPGTRTALLVLNTFVAFAFAAVGVVALLKTAFSGGGAV